MGRPKLRTRLRREARDKFVKSPEKITLRQIAKELGISEAGIHKWQKKDIDDGKGRWIEIREEYWAEKNKAKDIKDLTADTKKEVAELLNYEKAREQGIILLDKLRTKLSDDKLLDKITDQAKVRDILDLLKQIDKTAIGLGFADKIVIIGAEKPDNEVLETEFEILED